MSGHAKRRLRHQRTSALSVSRPGLDCDDREEFDRDAPPVDVEPAVALPPRAAPAVELVLPPVVPVPAALARAPPTVLEADEDEAEEAPADEPDRSVERLLERLRLVDRDEPAPAEPVRVAERLALPAEDLLPVPPLDEVDAVTVFWSSSSASFVFQRSGEGRPLVRFAT